MTVISWKFDGQETKMILDQAEKQNVILSSGQITVMIPQKKMVAYLEWIINQELKHGGI